MFRIRIPGLVLLVIAAVLTSCTDRSTPTEFARARDRRVGITTTGCLGLEELTKLVVVVFGSADMPNANSALSKLSTVSRKLSLGDVAGAQEHARALIDFIRQKATELVDRTRVQALIEGIECYAGITDDSFLVFPDDQSQTLVAGDGQAGLSLSGNPVSVPTLITIADLDSAVPPLETLLDQYPGFIQVTQQSDDPDGNALTGPVTVASCPIAGLPDSIANRLRLGHQAAPGAAGFALTPHADASFLTCTGYASAASKLPDWVRALASLVMPKPLYARAMFSGGVGGTAEAFSPFGPVDPVLNFSGGVGGTAEAFLRESAPSETVNKPPSDLEAAKPFTRRKNSGESVVLLGATACSQAVVGTELPVECRPRVELTTVRGTILKNVPVTWTIGEGGGQTAADDPTTRACGTFGTTALTATNLNGRAGACWKLGEVAGQNTLVATPGSGGDAPSGATFSPTSKTFTATALKALATLTLNGLTQTFDGTAKSVQVTTQPVVGLGTISVSYDGETQPPTMAGSYAVVATLDNASYQGTASGTLVIEKAASVVTVTCEPVSHVYTGSSLSPCTSTVTGAGGLNQSVTPSYADNTDVGTAKVTAVYAGDANHSASTGSGSFSITKAPSAVTVTCGGPYTYTGAALTPCTAVATGVGGLTQSVPASYTSNVDVGVAGVTATYEGDRNHTGSAGTGQFAIEKATPVLAWASPAAITLGTPLGATQLSASAWFGNPAIALSGSFAYAPPAGTVLPAGRNALSVTFSPASANFTTRGAEVQIDVFYLQVGCFSSPVWNVMPDTKSYQRKGSNVPIKCTLTDAQGAGVLNATGDLLVQDMGVVFGSPEAPYPKTVFEAKNVFRVSRGGNYAYGLDTSPDTFVSGHYYHVTALWNDGSTTVGWFFIK